MRLYAILVALLVASACAQTRAAAPDTSGGIAFSPGGEIERSLSSRAEQSGRTAPDLVSDPDRFTPRYARLAADLSQSVAGQPKFEGKLANWPLRGQITSPFGPRWGGFHTGLDIAVPMYTPVMAAASGIVVYAGKPYLAYGDTAMIVVVAHGPGFATMYVHLDDTRLRPTVKVGDRVNAGTIVGYVGLTGFTTGPHLHFMTVSAGRMVDPVPYLP